MNTGIYILQIGPWFYYGQTTDSPQRKSSHYNKLKKNKHPNQFLQEAYNYYKEVHFDLFAILPVEELNGAEQFFIDCFYEDGYCANISRLGHHSRTQCPTNLNN